MDFTGIKNYYEPLVFNYLQTEIAPQYPDQANEFFLDIACFALTKLPTRYIRHEIDLAFYLDDLVRTNMEAEVKDATDKALAYIMENPK